MCNFMCVVRFLYIVLGKHKSSQEFKKTSVTMHYFKKNLWYLYKRHIHNGVEQKKVFNYQF